MNPRLRLIPINNLKLHNESFTSKFQEKLDSFLKNGPYILGEEVKLFEDDFSKYIGVNHCVSVANGTDAIEIALKSLDLPKNSEVITAANAGMYSTISIINSGLKPKFVDIEKNGYNLDIQSILTSLSTETKAVIFTHLYGRATDLTFLRRELDNRNVFLIEDCAQSHGARFGERKVGSFGHLSTFSFYPTKNLGALGDGGAIATTEKKFYEKALSLRQYGWNKKYHLNNFIGRNSRLDEIQAIFLNIKLKHLNEFNSRRLNIAKRYLNEIKNKKIKIAEFDFDGSYVAHLFVIETVDPLMREKLIEYLRENEIGSDVHYPIPDYKQQPLKNLYLGKVLENTQSACDRILTLPCFPELQMEQVAYIIEKINKW